MIVTIRSRTLSLPRRFASWAGSMFSSAEAPGQDLRGFDFAPGRGGLFDSSVVERPRRRWPRRLALVVCGVCVLLLVALRGTGYRYERLSAPAAAPSAPTAIPAGASSELKQLGRDNRKLRAEVSRLAPSGLYIVVDRANNRLWMKRDDRIVYEAVCSSGSGMILREPNGERSWVFDTPSGKFRVLSKTEDPAWRKPDWAFIEEGKAIPRNPSDRIEYGVLGEYGLYFGDGYLIHGTLYERLLGRSVTHGCVRLGRDDLREVYRTATIGTPIYIF